MASTSPQVLGKLQTVGGLLAKTAYDGRHAAPGLSIAFFKFLRHTPIEPSMLDVIAFDKQVGAWHARACTPCMYARVHPADPCMSSFDKQLAQSLHQIRALSDEEVGGGATHSAHRPQCSPCTTEIAGHWRCATGERPLPRL